MDETTPAIERDLRFWCSVANRVARQMNGGRRNTCIATSHALAAFLRELGMDAEPFRAEMHAFPLSNDRTVHGFVLGSSGDGSRRPAAAPGMWHGHLAVSCGGYVLDPTIDQSAVGRVRLRPAVFAKPDGWETGTAHCWEERGLTVRYHQYYRQVGWKSAGDARPSHWRDITEVMHAYAAKGAMDIVQVFGD